MKNYKIKLNFVRDILGSQPSNDEIRRTYIKNKMMTGKTGMSGDVATKKIEEEIENNKKDDRIEGFVNELGDKTLTVFYRDKKGKPCISDVQIRGFMRDAFTFVGKEKGYLKKKDGEIYSGDEKYRKWIGDRISFKKQYHEIQGDTEIDILQRPIRVTTMQGPRVSIASSERIKEGASIEIEVATTDDVERKYIEDIFDRGMFKGISQWSNAQFGTFTYEILD